MVDTKPAAVVSGKNTKPQTAHFTKARRDLFRHANDVHATLDIKVRVSLWYNGELYEYASGDDVCSSALGNSNSTKLLRTWTPEDFVPISRGASISPGDDGDLSANDTELYHITSQVQGIIEQDNPGPTDAGSVQKITTELTLVDPAKQPPILDLTTPVPDTSSKKAILGTPSPPRRQLRCRRLGPAVTDLKLEVEPESPHSWRMDKHFGPSLAARLSTGGSDGVVRRTSNRHLRRHTTY
ncbi:hypothetical protein F5883DRAFT_182946 [Diaporthe sp. PMI_573]|nr:hypothetical protein F5883DRAFT_182946 [Diaporthaceae sp. PMI_573]